MIGSMERDQVDPPPVSFVSVRDGEVPISSFLGFPLRSVCDVCICITVDAPVAHPGDSGNLRQKFALETNSLLR